MPDLRLGIPRKTGDGARHTKQDAYVFADRDGDGITFTDLVCGRGFGKSFAAVRLAFDTAFVRMPGVPGLVTEMSDTDLFDIFVDRWQQVVPYHAYELFVGQKRIVCHTNPPTTIYLRSRHVTNPHKRSGEIGLTVGWAIHDEAATGFHQPTFDNFMMMVRDHRAPYHFIDTISTPLLGTGYHEYTRGDGHRVYRGTSYDNPFIPGATIDAWASQLDEDTKRREIYGEWVNLGGRIFKRWSDELWPRGNIYHGSFETIRAPWSLWADIGLNSSWLVVKHPPAKDGGRVVMGGPLDVVVAEYHPDGVGDTDYMTRLIDEHYGRPSAIYVGHDVGTRSTVDSAVHAATISNRWGSDLDILYPEGEWLTHPARHAAVMRSVQSGEGRRLCLADGCVNMTPGDARKARSFRRMIDEDAYPSGKVATLQTIWPKDHVHEHCRDAVSFGCVMRRGLQYGRNVHLY